MCDKFLDKPSQDYVEKLFVNKSFITEGNFLQLSEDDSHVQKIPAHASSSVAYPKVNLYYAFAEDTHPMKRIIAASKLFEKEILLPRSVPCKELFSIQEPYLEDEVVNQYLRTDPLTFVIFGKPGVNHTMVASAIADAWNCVLISPTSLIRQEIDNDTEKGRYIERLLRLGRSIGPKIVMNLIRCRVRMRDVKHRGYVIACLPFIPNDKSFDCSYSSSILDTNLIYPEFCENATFETCEVHEDRITFDVSSCEMQFDYEREIPRQIDEIFTVWPKKPLIIIYLVCPRQDIAIKCARQRMDPLTGNIFDENELTVQLFDDESENDESDFSFDFFQLGNERSFLSDDQRVVRLISDMPRNVEVKCNLYERLALPVIDKWILAHNPQYVIRVDGRSSMRRILKILKTRMHTLALQPSILPKKIIQEDSVRSSETFPQVNMSDELAEKSVEKAFEILRRRGIPSPKSPWGFSAWKFYCPVELAQGRTVKGLSKYAVQFLSKIFFLSSQEAESLFIENPRTFLLPPNPRPTCKIAIFGPKYAGKTELGARLAEVFGGTLINVDEIAKELIKRREESPIQKFYENNLDTEIFLKSTDMLPDEKADIIIQNIKGIPDEELGDDLRRDGGYVVDGMFMDVEVWRKMVNDANIVLEVVVVLFEEEPYTYLLNKFRSFSHLNDTMYETRYDVEENYEEYRMSHEDKEWEYLEHLIQFESEWTKFEEYIPEFGAVVIKCNLANIKDVTEYVINHIRRRFDSVDVSIEQKDEEYEIVEETTIVENGANLVHKDAKELHSTYTVDFATAKRFLDCGYYFFSSFGRWCPVQIYTNEIPIQMFLPMKARGQIFPVIRHPYVYFVAGEKELSAFLNDPSRYVAWNPCPLLLPLRVSIIGPPRCGKTTLANRFAKMYGIKVITRGKALRYMLKRYPWTESAQKIEKKLRAGQTAPMESVMRAIEMFSLGPRAATQGYVLDDCPSNRKEAEQLALLGIQPMIVLDLKADLEFCLECLSGNNDGMRKVPNFSANFLSWRYTKWHEDQVSFRDWLKKFSQNVVELDATRSKWHVWTRADRAIRSRFADIMLYFRDADLDKVHSLKNMCVSPYEFRSRQSQYKSFCPVCLSGENVLKGSGQLVDSRGMVQFREYFYWLCPQHIDAFVKDPLQYLSSVDKTLMSLLDERPRILQEIVDSEHACWARRLQVGGFCPVTYVDGLPDRKLTQGRADISLILKDKVYLFCGEECREKFLAQPDKYSEVDIVFPHEFPSTETRRLPDLTFLERTVTKALLEAVNLVVTRRPKIFGLSAAVSAAIYIGVYLKTRSKNSNEANSFEVASKRMAEQNRLIEIVTDSMKKKINPYVSLPKYPS